MFYFLCWILRLFFLILICSKIFCMMGCLEFVSGIFFFWMILGDFVFLGCRIVFLRLLCFWDRYYYFFVYGVIFMYVEVKDMDCFFILFWRCNVWSMSFIVKICLYVYFCSWYLWKKENCFRNWLIICDIN